MADNDRRHAPSRTARPGDSVQLLPPIELRNTTWVSGGSKLGPERFVEIAAGRSRAGGLNVLSSLVDVSAVSGAQPSATLQPASYRPCGGGGPCAHIRCRLPRGKLGCARTVAAAPTGRAAPGSAMSR